MAVIRAVAAKHNNFDAAQVAEMANLLFSANGWKTVSVSTVRKIIAENAHLLTAGRKGKRAHKSTVAMQLKRKVTEMPMVYWTLDGWTAELLYQEKGKKGMDYKRLVVVVVLDAWQKYPIGYAIGERETPELIREANINALLHVRELFGEVYRPVQLQSDHYAIKNLTPFYQAMTHLHTPAAVGNAKAKIIEPYFKDLNKNYCQKWPNWSGFNVTASKKNQVNAEMTDKIKNTFPDRAGVTKQIESIIARERAAKVATYVAKWPELPEERRYRMDVQQWIEVFGQAIGKTNRITGEGLVKQINGVEYVYDSFDPVFRANLNKNWQIIADVTDLSAVLAVSDDGKLRFLLQQKRVVPMDVMSSSPEDVAYRLQVGNFNKEREQEIIAQYGSDADIARETAENTPLRLDEPDELNLKLMLTVGGQQKERIQDAKGLRKVQKQIELQEARVIQSEQAAWDDQRLKFLTQDINLSEYGY